MDHSLVISADDPIEGSWNGFRFQISQEKDFPAMLENMKQHFCKDEPICQSMKHNTSIMDGMVEYARVSLVTGGLHSLVAYDQETGEVAGVRISTMLSKQEALKEHQKSDGYYGDFLDVLRLLAALDAKVKPNLFDKYGVDEIFEFRTLSVGSNYRQRGLALELCLRSLRLAKKQGARLAMVYFTSKFSRRVGEKLGFHLEAEVMYEDFKPHGKVIYKDMGLHKSCILMTKSL